MFLRLDHQLTQPLDCEGNASVTLKLLEDSLLHLIKFENINIGLERKTVGGRALLKLLDDDLQLPLEQRLYLGPGKQSITRLGNISKIIDQRLRNLVCLRILSKVASSINTFSMFSIVIKSSLHSIFLKPG